MHVEIEWILNDGMRNKHALQMLLKYIDLFVKYTCFDKTKYTVNPEVTLLMRSTDLNIMI